MEKLQKWVFNICPSAEKRTNWKSTAKEMHWKSRGDFLVPFSPILWKVLFLLYRVKSDWLIPVTQKNVITPAINMNISNCPTFSGVIFLVKTTLTIRKVIGLINWKSWSPEILFKNLIFFNSVQILYILTRIATLEYKKFPVWYHHILLNYLILTVKLNN